MKTISALTVPYAENPLWYHQFDLRQIRILRQGQPIVDIDAAVNCRLFVTTMKAMNFQDDIPQFSLINSKTTNYLCLIDHNAKCYWKFSLPRISWRTTKAGVKLYFSQRTCKWTHCCWGDGCLRFQLTSSELMGKNLKCIVFLSGD